MTVKDTVARRTFLKTVSLMPLAGWRPAKLAAEPPRRQPNILLLFSDQHHARAMSCAGHHTVKTPSLDRLAAKGVRFERAYCQDGICVPSRTSMMTGLYPRTTGCLDNGNDPVHPERYVMLQHLMQQNGYYTGCFGKRHLPGAGQMALGWDRSATTINPKLDPSDENYFDWLAAKGLTEAFEATHGKNVLQSDLFCMVSKLKPQERDAAYTALCSKAFLRQCKQQNRPFFCWASFHGPHQPYVPPQKWIDLYPADRMTLPENVDEPLEHLPPELQGWRKNMKQPWDLGKAAQDKGLYRTFLSHYYAQVTEVDHYIGEIVSELERLGLAENTVIIYASDHGDFMGYHGMTEKCALGHNVYEDTLRVPMIFSWPGRVKEGLVTQELTGLIDLYPTLIDLLNLKTPQGLQQLAGVSLKPLLEEGKALDRAYIFSENWSQAAVISKRYKLGVWQETGPLAKYERRDWRKAFKDMLFDLKNDPLETDNQIDNPKLTSVQQRLRRALARWMTETSEQGKTDYIAAHRKG